MKRIVCILMLLMLFFPLLSLPLSADTGPKPSLRIRFENMPDAVFYGAIFSEGERPMPDVTEREETEGLKAARKILAAYEDEDGFLFDGNAMACVSDAGSLSWTYYPPERFKVVLYFPETERIVVSEICERYAFDTYYTVNMVGEGMDAPRYDESLSNDDRIKAYRSYELGRELLGLAARILITLACEMLLALLLGFVEKRALLLLLWVNLATQIALNLLLNLIHFLEGNDAFFIGYVLLELLVFAVEAFLYCRLMKTRETAPRSNRFYIGYAFAANLLSFVVGLGVALYLPGLF